MLPALLQRLKGWGVSLSVLRPNAAHCIKLVCIAVVPEGSLCKQFAEDKQTKDMDYWNHVLWSDKAKINLFGSDAVKRVCVGNQVRSTKTSVSWLKSSMVVGVSWSGAA